jgi:hypothetical protein
VGSEPASQISSGRPTVPISLTKQAYPGHATRRLLSRLQDVCDQQKHKSQHDNADKNKVPRASSGRSVIVEFAPVPQVGIIGRHGTYWRGHQPSVGSAPKWARGFGASHTQEVDHLYNRRYAKSAAVKKLGIPRHPDGRIRIPSTCESARPTIRRESGALLVFRCSWAASGSGTHWGFTGPDTAATL